MLYQVSALFCGVLVAIMVTANGMLKAAVGDLGAVLSIHICGLIAISLMLLIRRKRFSLRAPLSICWAGVIGVCTTLLNNLCFEPLGAALMLALCVVGQIATSALVDHFGLMGMTRYPFSPKKLIGFGLMGAGLLMMSMA